MAFQDVTSASSVLNHEMTATRNFFGTVGKWFEGALTSLSMASSAQHRFERVQALQAKTDEELAALKIRRDDIVHHVFRDLYYV